MDSYWLIEYPESRRDVTSHASQGRAHWLKGGASRPSGQQGSRVIPELACQYLYDPPLFFFVYLCKRQSSALDHSKLPVQV